MSSLSPSGAIEVLERWRHAAIAQSVDDMSSLYATDAVHEFPFTRPGIPSRIEGRDAIMSFIAGFWGTGLLQYERYKTIALYETSDPEVIVVEQEVEGISSTTGSFTLPNIVVLKVNNGVITHLRDYANVLAVEEVVRGPVSK